MRNTLFAEGEYYHVFNRGVERRDVFCDDDDLARFLLSMRCFNTEEPIGSLYEHGFTKNEKATTRPSPIVDILAYCLNPNHYHLVLFQRAERGIPRFMQRLGTGYTNYFNEKYERTGSLFQGTYKAVHITSNEQLLHTSVYVNLNNKLGSLTPKLSRSSWAEYTEGEVGICMKDIVLRQFGNSDAYIRYAHDARDSIVERKKNEKEMQWLFGS